jgi:sirohydrochlorin ferrochelatase
MYRKVAGLLWLTIALASPDAGWAAQTGLLVVAHGSSVEWNDQVRQTVTQVRWPHGPIATAFLMGPEAETRSWNDGIAQLAAAGVRSIVVVPLMVSSHGSHYRQIRFYAGELPHLPPELRGHDHGDHTSPPVPTRVTPALDAAPELLEAVATRWTELAPPRRDAPMLLLGHGPNDESDAARWIAALETSLEQVRALGYRGEARPALLRDDAPPPVRAAAISGLRDTVMALAARNRDSVTVMTVMVARGPMTSARIPQELRGLPVRYAPAGLTPLPAIARWIERVAEETLVVGR